MPPHPKIHPSRPVHWALTVLFAILILACRPTVSIATSTRSAPQDPQITPTIKVKLPNPFDFPSPDGRHLGDLNASITVEVFSDFQCPACKQYATDVEPRIIQQYVTGGSVQYVYHHYAFIGPESVQAANASMCAAEQNRFWEYHNLLFINQAGENQGAFSDEKLLAYASAAGVEINTFTTCFAQKRYQADIEQDMILGKSKGVSAVPAVFVNRIAITPGNMPGVKDIQKAINNALAQP
jgi:protein-disulfide isomerase